jgi:hypothetical protein
MKIRDQGTFYHLIPDNPNAVEWVIFWLRLFRPDAAKLSTIRAGSESLVVKLIDDLRSRWNDRVRLETAQEVTAVRPGPTADTVALDVLDTPSGRVYDITADEVVLALPQRPIQLLCEHFPTVVQHDVDSVIGFPLLKAFWVGPTPSWWNDATPQPHAGAWSMPTREVHYVQKDQRAMMMIYTDHPATEYWKQYLTAPERHECAEVDPRGQRATDLKHVLAHCLVAHQRLSMRAELLALIQKYGGSDSQEAHVWDPPLDDIPKGPERRRAKAINEALRGYPWAEEQQLANGTEWFGIRDWSKEPYCAGCHAWKAGVKSWEVRERMKAFALLGRSRKNIHVCGEAYSGYQGFIEGALQSAEDAIGGITRTPC